MKDIFVRPARKEDWEKFSEWITTNQQNALDPDVISYSQILCAYDADGPLVFMPVQRPLMMESLAVRPDAEGWEVAQAIKELHRACVTQAHLNGAGEMYFVGSSDLTNRFAERHGFEKLPWSVYRMKLSDLEK